MTNLLCIILCKVLHGMVAQEVKWQQYWFITDGSFPVAWDQTISTQHLGLMCESWLCTSYKILQAKAVLKGKCQQYWCFTACGSTAHFGLYLLLLTNNQHEPRTRNANFCYRLCYMDGICIELELCAVWYEQTEYWCAWIHTTSKISS